MVIRDFILDWSGTLVDDLRPVWLTTNHVLSTCGAATLTLDEFRREFCLPIGKFYQRLTPAVSEARLGEIFLAKYAALRHEITVLPHTVGFLEFCARRGCGVYVASTADPVTYHQQMERFDLARFITKAYVGIADKTQTIHRILEENELDRRATLFVGDMEHDIEAGQAGGVRTCAVLSGYTHAAPLHARSPDLVCEHLGALRDLFDEEGRLKQTAGARDQAASVNGQGHHG